MLIFCIVLAVGVSCDRPRGVSLTRASFYVDQNGQFACLDGSGKIPYDQVNDDFCDCSDGSDEPGTAACSNGMFHCTNAGFKPMNVFSSRVNDMICDCCDGSDEWAGYVTCPNTCKEAYAREYSDKIKQNAVQAEGWEKRKSMVADAIAEKDQNAVDLAEHDVKLAEITVEKDKAEELRNSAESAENAANAIIEQRKDELVLEQAALYDDETLSQIAFNHIDSNSNGELVQYEITAQKYLDPTPETSFLPSEAKTMMKEMEKITIDEFRTDMWPEIKDKITPKLGGAMARYERDLEDEERKKIEEEEEAKRQLEEPAEIEETEPEEIKEPEPMEVEPEQCDGDNCDHTIDDIVVDEAEEEVDTPIDHIQDELDELGDLDQDYDDEEMDDDDFDDDDEDYRYDDEYEEDDYHEDYDEDNYNRYKKEPVVAPSDPEMDPETQKIFDTATEARRVFNEVNDRYKDVEERVKEIQEQTGTDFGPDDVYMTMYKQCYELRTTEYIYKLCPYDRASQKPLNGGSETKLGNWKGFNDDYSKMLFTGGVRCWNGPDRSATIVLSCGDKHKVLSVDEPNRCEYEYKFETPAVCDQPEELTPPSEHDEL